MKEIFKIEEVILKLQRSLQNVVVKPVKGKINEPISFQVVDFKISIPLNLQAISDSGLTFKTVDTYEMITKGKSKELDNLQLTRVELSFKPLLTESIEETGK